MIGFECVRVVGNFFCKRVKWKRRKGIILV